MNTTTLTALNYKVALLGNIELLNYYSHHKIVYQDISSIGEYAIEILPNKHIYKIDAYNIILLVVGKNLKEDILLCQKCRSITSKPIIVCGPPNTNYTIEMLKAGADIYEKAPFTEDILRAIFYVNIKREYR